MLFIEGMYVTVGGGVWVDSVGLIICKKYCRIGMHGFGAVIVVLDVDGILCV